MVKPKDVTDDILDLLATAKFGMSISKIAQKLDCSRSTITKYLKVLEDENKIFGQDVGQYKLWFHKERYQHNQEIHQSLSSFFEPIYFSILKNLPEIGVDKEKIIHLGKLIANDLDFSNITEEMLPSLEGMPEIDLSSLLSKGMNLDLITKNKQVLDSMVQIIMQIIDSLCKSFDNYMWKTPIILHDSSVFILRLENSTMITVPSHFYLLAGVLEEEMGKFFPVKVSINQLLQKENLVDFKFQLLS